MDSHQAGTNLVQGRGALTNLAKVFTNRGHQQSSMKEKVGFERLFPAKLGRNMTKQGALVEGLVLMMRGLTERLCIQKPADAHDAGLGWGGSAGKPPADAHDAGLDGTVVPERPQLMLIPV